MHAVTLNSNRFDLCRYSAVTAPPPPSQPLLPKKKTIVPPCVRARTCTQSKDLSCLKDLPIIAIDFFAYVTVWTNKCIGTSFDTKTNRIDFKWADPPSTAKAGPIRKKTGGKTNFLSRSPYPPNVRAQMSTLPT